VNKKISFSSLELSNISLIDSHQVVVQDLNIEINNLIIDKNFFKTTDFSIDLDTSYLHGSCVILNEEITLDIKDSNVSPFEYGRTRRCLDTIDDIYENLDRKVLDFDSLLND